MPTIHFIALDGARNTILAEIGQSVMQAAIAGGVPGIEAICGGYCSCATCHVYVGDAWLGKLPPIAEDENEMLDGAAADRQPNSRLSCQIKMAEDLDGIEIVVPPVQA